MNKFFGKLPFKGMAEKIPAETRAKMPLLDKVIPFTNQIVCGLAVLLVVVVIACSAGGGTNSASDFSYDLTEDGQGIIIKNFTGKGGGKVVVPAKIEGVPVVEIGSEAFDGKSLTMSLNWNSASANVGSKANAKAGIKSIILPDTVKKIGSGAFANTSLTKFNMPDSVTEIVYSSVTGTNYLFSGCDKLTEIHFSDSLEILPETLFGFGGAKSLKKANLPKNLKQITDYTFGGCGELSDLIIPDTLKTLEFVSWGSKGYGASDSWMKDGSPNYNGADGAVYTAKSFTGCGKLPIKTRQKLQELGYKDSF